MFLVEKKSREVFLKIAFDRRDKSTYFRCELRRGAVGIKRETDYIFFLFNECLIDYQILIPSKN